MAKAKRKGMSAAEFFYGRSFTSADRQPLPVIPMANARPIVEIAMDDIADDNAPLNPPVEIPPRKEDDAISQAFEATRDTIAELEASRSENVDPSWSPAQHVRAA